VAISPRFPEMKTLISLRSQKEMNSPASDASLPRAKEKSRKEKRRIEVSDRLAKKKAAGRSERKKRKNAGKRGGLALDVSARGTGVGRGGRLFRQHLPEGSRSPRRGTKKFGGEKLLDRHSCLQIEDGRGMGNRAPNATAMWKKYFRPAEEGSHCVNSGERSGISAYAS